MWSVTDARVRLAGAAVLAAILLCSAPARAGLFDRPGGPSFAGVDAPNTILSNPAGLMLPAQTMALAGVGLLLKTDVVQFDPASYVDSQGKTVTPARETGKAPVLPSLPLFGVSSRFAKQGGKAPLPVAFGIGFFPAFTGALSFDRDKVRDGMVRLDARLYELTPAIAYRINRYLAVGASLRIGFGTLELENSENDSGAGGSGKVPFDLSLTGTSVGTTLGLMVTPAKWVRLGVSYGAPMTISYDGDGVLQIPGQPDKKTSVSTDWHFPQWVGVGAHFTVAMPLQLHAGLRWTDWSAFRDFTVDFGGDIPTQREEFLSEDGLMAMVGFRMMTPPNRFTLGRPLIFDFTFSVDTQTLPDTTIDRHQPDMTRLGIEASLAVPILRTLIFQVGTQITKGLEREVPDAVATRVVDPNKGTTEEAHVNRGPGKYHFDIYALTLGLLFMY